MLIPCAGINAAAIHDKGEVGVSRDYRPVYS